jgi:hypothetical protein
MNTINIMNIDEFSKEISRLVSEKMGPEYDIRIMEVQKNNGVTMHSLNIINGRVNINPCIYLDGFYDRYMRDVMGMEYIAEAVVGIYKENIPDANWDISAFTDYERAKGNLRGRLINAEKNRELLKTMPHREFLDLALVYSVDYPDWKEDNGGSIQVKNSHMERWGVGEEELFRQMKENMQTCGESLLQNMMAVLGEMAGMDEATFDYMEKTPMHVLTNRRKCNGAVEMLDEDALKEAAELYGGDFMILPSSIHEILLLPVRDEKEEIEELAATVREVNDTKVAPDEILSFHVYRYSCMTGTVSIVA